MATTQFYKERLDQIRQRKRQQLVELCQYEQELKLEREARRKVREKQALSISEDDTQGVTSPYILETENNVDELEEKKLQQILLEKTVSNVHSSVKDYLVNEDTRQARWEKKARAKEEKRKKIEEKNSSPGKENVPKTMEDKMASGYMHKRKNYEKQCGNAFISGLCKTTSTASIPESLTFISQEHHLTSPLAMSSLKAGHLFDDYILPTMGMTELFGISPTTSRVMYKITHFKPVLMEAISHQLCSGECYLIVDPILEMDSGSHVIQYKIYQWVGHEASIDKLACSAIFSVQLRNFICSSYPTQREEEGKESEHFRALFTDRLEYVDASQATSSSLFKVEPKIYPLRLYKVVVNKLYSLQLVETCQKSLESTEVFILDSGMKIFMWIGSKCMLKSKVLGELRARAISSHERNRRAELFYLEEGKEEKEFLDLLETKSENESLEKLALSAYTKLYSLTLDSGEIKECLIPYLESLGGPTQDMLKSQYCFILDCGTEIYLWIGKKSSSAIRENCTHMLTKVLVTQQRYRWMAFHRVFEDYEPESFKSHFVLWNKMAFPELPTQKEYNMLGIEAIHQLLSQEPITSSVTPKIYIQMLEYLQNCVISLQAFVAEDGKFKRLPDSNVGHFSDSSIYIYLCLFRINPEKHSSLEFPPELCSLYFPEIFSDDILLQVSRHKSSFTVPLVFLWKGENATKLSYLSFKFNTERQVRQLVYSIHKSYVRIIEVEQQKEPPLFLMLLPQQSMSVISGKPLGKDNFHLKIFHILTTTHLSSKVTRAIQILPSKNIINHLTGSFLLISTETQRAMLWTREEISKDVSASMEGFCESILGAMNFSSDYKMTTIIEGQEKGEYINNFEELYEAFSPDSGVCLSRVDQPTRFLQCRFNIQEFSCIEVVEFCQADLLFDRTVVLVKGEKVYLWIGWNSNPVLFQYTIRSLEWHLSKSLCATAATWEEVRQFSEPEDFKQAFHGWSCEHHLEPSNLYKRTRDDERKRNIQGIVTS